MPGRLLITLIVIDKRPVLRITQDGEVQDFPLTDGQAKLVLLQLAEWITRQ